MWVKLRSEFSSAYRRRYGHFDENWKIEIAELKVRVEVQPQVNYRALRWSEEKAAKKWSPSKCYFAGQWHDATSYDRLSLRGGSAYAGPALIHDGQSTILVPPSGSATADEFGNVVVNLTW